MHDMYSQKNRLTEEERMRQRRRRAKQERIRRLRRLRRILIASMVLILAALIVSGVLIYRNTYTGIVNRGEKAIRQGNDGTAEKLFKKAIDKKGEGEAAYLELAKLYEKNNEEKKADKLFENAISNYPDAIDVYKAAVKFYETSGREEKIAPIMNQCTNEVILSELSEYVAKVPVFSLEEDKVYDDVQELTLSSEEEGTIYYTTDGSEATTDSTEYKEPIHISKEGKTTVRAIFVNKKGIPSMEITKTFTIAFPVADAPAVSPAAGEFTKAIQVEIQVPKGYTAYYTTDGSEPTEKSAKYTGPVTLNKNVMLKAVLIDGKGKKSEITTRRYEFSAE